MATPEWQIIHALDEIEVYQPNLLMVDPTYFAFLARRARRLGRKISSPRKLHMVSAYTPMTRVARRQIEEFMGPDVPVGDMLAMSELGYLGFECHYGRRHINDVDFYLEFVRNGMPVEVGQTGELYVTTIDDCLMPRIRYATGDCYTPLGKSCECGSELPVVRVEGRVIQMIQLKDGRTVTPGGLDSVVGDSPWMDLYQLEQDRTGACTFRYVPNAKADVRDAAALEARLAKALAPNDIRLQAVDYIACERSGKLQPCLSRISAEGAQ
jgi:phenylacetate-CoA ligase